MEKTGSINMDKDRWFATCDDFSLCRMGGNGPINVSQLMPIVQYVKDGDSFLDVGCGSGTTLDALNAVNKKVLYKGTDIIEHRIEWLKNTYDREFEVQDARHLQEDDKSWDIVWSRHVVDHLSSFEEAMDEHCRVAKKMVICILWMELMDIEEHHIKPIVDQGVEYKDEWTNQYSRDLVKGYLADKCESGWKLREFLEKVTWDGSVDGKGRDTIIVLERI